MRGQYTLRDFNDNPFSPLHSFQVHIKPHFISSTLSWISAFLYMTKTLSIYVVIHLFDFPL